jgi:hypothetical protein
MFILLIKSKSTVIKCLLTFLLQIVFIVIPIIIYQVNVTERIFDQTFITRINSICSKNISNIDL